MDEQYERMRAALLAALAEHERGRLDNAGLQASIEALRGTLDGAHADVQQALFEADVALEYAEDGRPGEVRTRAPRSGGCEGTCGRYSG